jgi:hypothetical protein
MICQQEVLRYKEYMKQTAFRIFAAILLSIGGGCLSCVYAAPNEITPPVKASSERVNALEQKRAVEEVNTLIIDSYRARLDQVLEELYANIAKASKGNRAAQVKALIIVRDDLDARLDAISEANVTANRKKILMGVYFYLKTNIDEKVRQIQEK